MESPEISKTKAETAGDAVSRMGGMHLDDGTEPEASRPGRPLTVEAIRREPWNAINLVIPRDESRELLE